MLQWLPNDNLSSKMQKTIQPVFTSHKFKQDLSLHSIFFKFLSSQSFVKSSWLWDLKNIISATRLGSWSNESSQQNLAEKLNFAGCQLLYTILLPKPNMSQPSNALFSNLFICGLCDAGYVGYTKGHLHMLVEGHSQKALSIYNRHSIEHNTAVLNNFLPCFKCNEMLCIVQFQKISILFPHKGLEFPGVWGVL